jgi:hypothetical protein
LTAPVSNANKVKRVLPLVVFVYLIFIRTRGISQTFWLLGDQILYWRIALGSWRDLPVGGGPSSVGGTTIGPVFCWVLWGIRHLIGPWVHNLPHAGAIGLSIIQSAADAFFFVAIWRRSASVALALAVTLFVASAPYDMALTATVTNPPLAVALVKTAIACVLFERRAGRAGRPGRAGGADTAGVAGGAGWVGPDEANRAVSPDPPNLPHLPHLPDLPHLPNLWSLGATATAVLAVQAHSSAVFFAVPLIASFVLRELVKGRWTRALRVGAALAAVILVLEAPFLVDRVMHPDKATSPATVVGNVSYTVAHPSALRPAAAFRAGVQACEFILLRPWTFGWMGSFLVLCATIAVYRARRDLTLICATVVPLVAAVVGYSFWQGAYDHYYYLVLAPGVALMIAWALTAWRPIAPYAAIALAALALLAQPARVTDAMTFHRLPVYGALVRGSLEMRRYTPEIYGIQTTFELPPTSDPAFLYETLGGRISPDARLSAKITQAGTVAYSAVPPRNAPDGTTNEPVNPPNPVNPVNPVH